MGPEGQAEVPGILSWASWAPSPELVSRCSSRFFSAHLGSEGILYELEWYFQSPSRHPAAFWAWTGTRDKGWQHSPVPGSISGARQPGFRLRAQDNVRSIRTELIWVCLYSGDPPPPQTIVVFLLVSFFNQPKEGTLQTHTHTPIC